MNKCIACSKEVLSKRYKFTSDCSFKRQSERDRINSRKRYLKLRNNKGLPSKFRLLHD